MSCAEAKKRPQYPPTEWMAIPQALAVQLAIPDDVHHKIAILAALVAYGPVRHFAERAKLEGRPPIIAAT